MKKLTSLISCLLLLCLIGCNTASGGSGNPDEEQPDSTAGFTIYNFCDTDIIVCVGTIPKQGDKYDWSQQNRFSIMQPKTIKKNEKLIVPVAELQSNQSYLIGANPPNVNSLY